MKLQNFGKVVSELRVYCRCELKSETAYQIAKFLYLKIEKRCCIYFINEKNSFALLFKIYLTRWAYMGLHAPSL